VSSRTAVVIPNWNGLRHLERCLTALRGQSEKDFDVVLVDNGSTDDSVTFVRERFPEVQILELEENRGFAAGMNAGIGATDTTYVAFLNNDTEVAPDWLRELVACIERHPKAASASSKMLDASDPAVLDGAGDVLGPSFLPHPRGNGARDQGQFDEDAEVFSASGGAALWRADALYDVGLFDERFYLYYEDVDLGYRARRLGYECWYSARSVVLHHGSATLGKKSDVGLFHFVRNRWFLIVKNTPARLIVRWLPGILVGDGYFWMIALKRRRIGVLLRAYRDLFRQVGYLRAERRAQAARARIDVRELKRAIRLS
jgi:GT2 family glycosyltransferase